MTDFPKMIYRGGSAFVWDGRGVDSMVVSDAQAHADALGAGWFDATDLTSLHASIDAPPRMKAKAKGA